MGRRARRDYADLTETEVLDDIRRFRERLERAEPPQDSLQATQQEVYRELLQQRRKLLSAIRAGRPELWFDYPPAQV